MNPYKIYQQALRSPWKWVVIIATLIYFISPIDAFPEILVPFVGYIDDGLLLLLLVRELGLIYRENQTKKRQNKVEHK